MSESPTTVEQPLDLRLVLPALAAWAGAGLAIDARMAGLALGLGVLGALIGLGRRAWTLCAVGIALLGAGLVAAWWGWTLTSSMPAAWAREGALVEVQAVVQSDLREFEPSAARPAAGVLRVRLVDVRSHGEHWQGALPAEIRATGEQLSAIDQPVGATINLLALAGEPDVGEKSVARLGLRSDVRLVSEPGAGHELANRFRSGLRQAMAHSPPQQAGLVPSLVVGDTSGLPPEITTAFKKTALTHLLAVSGTNLTLMLVFSLGLARQLGVRGWWLRASGVGVTLAFVVVCRGEPSVLRAAAMGLIAMAATGLAQDRRRGLRALSLAVLVLVLIDPWLARSWGFALSVCASAGILWWGSAWQLAMRTWAPGWLAESLAIPLAAQLATQPLVTALSGEVSVVGLAANALAAPFVGPVTILGLLAGLVALISPALAAIVGWLAGWCVQPIVLTAELLSDAPAATWHWPVSPATLTLLSAACLMLGHFVVPRVLPSRVLALGMGLLLVIGAFRPPPQPGWPGDWSVIACDVGQGGAQLIRAGPRSAILVDTGPEPEALQRCLLDAGINHIGMLVITHPHADHIGGLPALVDRVPVDLVLAGQSAGGEWTPTPSWATGLPQPRQTSPGDQVQVGQARWTTLAAGPVPAMLATSGAENAADNDAGVVGMVETGGLRVLVTGDLEVAGQQALVHAGQDLSADVLVVPHHGSPRHDAEFFAASDAAIALIQVGERNDYGHPAAVTLRTLASMGAQVFRTDLQGALAVSSDGRQVVTQR